MVNKPETQLVLLMLCKESSDPNPTTEAAGNGKYAGHLFLARTADSNPKIQVIKFPQLLLRQVV